jgi:hypothetical protein
MNGGLLKSTSRLALFAAAGLFASGMAMPSAKAADLGGDCCADLEERVAELEATTARKGNRKMSLTITGQVNKIIQYWDDGVDHAVRYGLDNTNSSSRFSFLGEARVSPSVKVGFEIMIETEGVNTSSRHTQLNEDGTFSQTTYMSPTSVAQGPANAGNSDSFFGDARRVAVWIEDRNLGRATLGRYESAGVVGTIDLGGIGAIASPSVALLNGTFATRLKDGSITPVTFSSLLDPAAFQGRTDLIRYDSPSFGGFIFSASIAEESSGFQSGYWGTMLRYAGEFSGFKIAAGIGYEHWADRWTQPTLNAGTGGITVANTLIPSIPPGGSGYSQFEPDSHAWGGSLAFLHVPSGLFLQGSYMKVSYDDAGSVTDGYWGNTCGASTSGGTPVNFSPIPFTSTAAGGFGACNPKSDADFWQIQGGITKNWFGWGNTALYAEYNKLRDWGAEEGGRNYTSSTSPASAGYTQVFNVTSTDVQVFGLGIVQNLDAAATELYLGWRHFDVDSNNDMVCSAGAPGGVIGNTGKALGTVYGAAAGCQFENMDIVTAGARVKF